MARFFVRALTATFATVVVAACGGSDGNHDPGDTSTPGDSDPITVPGAWSDATHTSSLGSRTYRVYLPADFDAAAPAPAPLLLLLHGCAQTAEEFAAITRIAALADLHGLIVVMPAQGTSANSQRCWNWFLPQNQARGGEAALLVEILDEVEAAHAVDPTRVFVAGLSAGGAMSAILTSCYADRFAAAGVHSGLMFEAATNVSQAMSAMAAGSSADPATTGHDAYVCSGSPTRAPPTLVIHGDADTTVAPANGPQVVAELLTFADYADNGANDGSVSDTPTSTADGTAPGGLTYDVSHYGAPSQVDALVVHGLGHAWSGGASGHSYSDPDGPDATTMLWDFLAAHPR